MCRWMSIYSNKQTWSSCFHCFTRWKLYTASNGHYIVLAASMPNYTYISITAFLDMNDNLRNVLLHTEFILFLCTWEPSTRFARTLYSVRPIQFGFGWTCYFINHLPVRLLRAFNPPNISFSNNSVRTHILYALHNSNELNEIDFVLAKGEPTGMNGGNHQGATNNKITEVLCSDIHQYGNEEKKRRLEWFII